MFNWKNDDIFREPDGFRDSGLYAGAGIISLGLGIYFQLHGDDPTLYFAWATLFLLFALAEGLPAERRKLSGRVRLAALVVAMLFIGYIFFPI